MNSFESIYLNILNENNKIIIIYGLHKNKVILIINMEKISILILLIIKKY